MSLLVERKEEEEEIKRLPPIVITSVSPDGEQAVWPDDPTVPFWDEKVYFTWNEYEAELSRFLKNYVEIATFPDVRNEEWHYAIYLREDLYNSVWGAFMAPGPEEDPPCGDCPFDFCPFL